MKKIRIVHEAGTSCSLNADWMKEVTDPWLEFEIFDSTLSYQKDTLFFINGLNLDQSKVSQLQNQGFRVCIDNFWEPRLPPVPHTCQLRHELWFWFNESLWYHWLQLDQYQPNPRFEYTALMPVNLARAHRQWFIYKLGKAKDSMLWSNVQRGRQLPWDADMSLPKNQRYFDSRWYDLTSFSVVLETLVDPDPYQEIFITEKTFKPMAFSHPFMIFAQPGALAWLRSHGFETFENLWDESYDQVQDWTQRGLAIIQQVCRGAVGRDSLTQQKIDHNRAKFFDIKTVTEKIVKEIIEPLIEYAET